MAIEFERRLMRKRETAVHLTVGEWTINSLQIRGGLVPVKISRCTRFRVEDIKCLAREGTARFDLSTERERRTFSVSGVDESRILTTKTLLRSAVFLLIHSTDIQQNSWLHAGWFAVVIILAAFQVYSAIAQHSRTSKSRRKRLRCTPHPSRFSSPLMRPLIIFAMTSRRSFIASAARSSRRPRRRATSSKGTHSCAEARDVTKK